MAVIWMDSFDWIAAGTTPASSPTLDTLIDERYPSSTLTDADAEIQAGPGPGQQVKFGDATAERIYITVPTIPRSATMYGMMRVKIFQSATANPFLSFYSTTGNEAGALHIGPSFNWYIERLGSTYIDRFNVLGASWGEWFTLEWAFRNENAPDGQFSVRVNGTAVSTNTGIDTYNFGTGISEIRIRNLGSGGDRGYEIRDLIICDDNGSICNTWIGQQKHVYQLAPNADGTTSQWTRSTGSVDYSLIDEVSRDSTDYIESSTSTNKTTVNFEATGSETDVLAVQVMTNSFLDAAGSETMQHVVRHSSSESNSSNITVDQTSEEVHTSIFETNPSTAAQWTAAEIDAMEAGVEYQ